MPVCIPKYIVELLYIRYLRPVQFIIYSKLVTVAAVKSSISYIYILCMYVLHESWIMNENRENQVCRTETYFDRAEVLLFIYIGLVGVANYEHIRRSSCGCVYTIHGTYLHGVNELPVFSSLDICHQDYHTCIILV